MSPKTTMTMRGAVLVGVEKIEIQDVAVPTPGPGEILLGVEAATTCGTDVKVFRRGGHPRMLKVPTLFGHEVSGRVAVLGPGVENFSEGDAVVVANSAPCLQCEPCKMGRENLCEDLHYINGAFAEYLLVPKRFVERNTHAIPMGLTFEKAALTEPLGCVLHGIDACDLHRYDSQGPVEIVVFGGGPIGLLFVGALAEDGHRVILADPNPNRLSIGKQLGAAETIEIVRGGGQAERVRAATKDQKGAWVAIDSTGVQEVWSDAIDSVRPGGLVNLFGGCAPGTSIELDTHLVHYSELTIKGVYHHRPETIKRALALLSNPNFKAELLLSAERPIEEVEDALRSMISKEALKVVIKNR
ncbi:MAG: alcohol dehydrogenase catalytic domain-containing protein [Proteobacteria bacterium]|nr:alcohol dehydrogenase catalytic domain-containing protein [Pseudomonadota bacterium]